MRINFRNQVINLALSREIIVLNKSRTKSSFDQIFAILFSEINAKILLHFLCEITQIKIFVQTKLARITIVISKNISLSIVLFSRRKTRKLMRLLLRSRTHRTLFKKYCRFNVLARFLTI